MAKSAEKKVQTDADVKKKSVKLVISHLKKKAQGEFIGADHINHWLDGMDELLSKDEFILVDYIQMRKGLNDAIERVVDEETRFKMRDSWYSLGKALDKKVKRN